MNALLMEMGRQTVWLRLHSNLTQGADKWEEHCLGCCRWGLKGCLASLPGISYLGRPFYHFRPFPLHNPQKRISGNLCCAMANCTSCIGNNMKYITNTKQTLLHSRKALHFITTYMSEQVVDCEPGLSRPMENNVCSEVTVVNNFH